MRVAVGTHKGGVGKTTTAVMLALQLAADGPTVLVDTDTSRGASRWHSDAVEDGYPWPESLTVVEVAAGQPITLPPGDLAHVVIDTGPNDRARLREALALVDLAVIPVGARALDVRQLGDTLDDVEQSAGERPLVYAPLVTMRDARTREARHELAEAFRAGDVEPMTTVVPYGALYRRAAGTVPTRFGAYADVLAELRANDPQEAPRARA